MAWLGNFLKKSIFNFDQSPNKVIEVKTDKYVNRQVISRDESLILYAAEKDDTYEIIMQKPFSESLDSGFSLFRTEDKVLAVHKFNSIKDKLSFLCDASILRVETIQKYCDIIDEHPTWTLCHLLVHFNLVAPFSQPRIQSLINATDAESGLSPLHLAISESNLPMVTLLIKNGASLEQLDHDSNTVFHYAATANKDIVNSLAESGQLSKLLSHRNITGHTALHMACLADRPECVIALIAKGADVNMSAAMPSGAASPPRSAGIMGDFLKDFSNKLNTQEMKNGGTPLHWSASKEVIITLIERNCDINALNFASQTALHVMVMRERLDCVVALLAREAEIDIPDFDGNTALHLAVKQKNIPIVQALIAFGCDIDLYNNAGETPRHIAALHGGDIGSKLVYVLHAVGAKRCSANHNFCTLQCKDGGEDNGIPPPPASGPTARVVSDLLQSGMLDIDISSKRGGRLLCLDGGGIRGLVLIVILLHLEKAVGKPIIHCFDWLAATSTGGILALGLAAGKTLKEALCLYFRMKDQVFCGMRPYSSEPLEALLKETLGRDTTMADITHPKLIITGCLADRKPVDLHIFRNYESTNEILSAYPHPTPTCPKFKPLPSFRNQLLWEAARASGAAPSYFRSFERFVDGGLIANNPTLDALTEIHEFNTALKAVKRNSDVVDVSVVVSVGTGSVPLIELSCMDIYWPSGVLDAARAFAGAKSLLPILIDQATQADGRVVDRSRAICSMLNVPYFRFSPQLSEDVAMDEKSDEILVNMLWETKAFMTSQSNYVEKLASLLNQ